MYNAEKQRKKIKLLENDQIEEFISSLEISLNIKRLEEKNIERAAQLTQRTNQFNANGIRKTTGELFNLLKQENKLNWSISVSDKFGDYGLVGIVLAEMIDKTLHIHTFLLSCRVLGRNIEHKVIEELQSFCNTNQISEMILNFRETPKNKPFKIFLDTVNSPVFSIAEPLYD